MGVANTIILLIALFMLILTIVLIVVGIKLDNDLEIIAVLPACFTLFFGAYAFLCPDTTLEESEMIIQTPIVAFEDNTNTKIYGRISGGLLYTQGEIQSKQEYILTVLSLDSDNKATFKHFDIDEVNIYFIETGKAYYEYRYDTETKAVIIFGKQIGQPEHSKHLVETNIYLPINSVQYDNEING